MYIESFPKKESASCLIIGNASFNSFLELTIFIPLPPPPALALSKTGYPISSLAVSASDSLLTSPSEPGTVGTPNFFIIFLASILSPIISI